MQLNVLFGWQSTHESTKTHFWEHGKYFSLYHYLLSLRLETFRLLTLKFSESSSTTRPLLLSLDGSWIKSRYTGWDLIVHKMARLTRTWLRPSSGLEPVTIEPDGPCFTARWHSWAKCTLSIYNLRTSQGDFFACPQLDQKIRHSTILPFRRPPFKKVEDCSGIFEEIKKASKRMFLDQTWPILQQVQQQEETYKVSL